MVKKVSDSSDISGVFPFIVRSPAQAGAFIRRLRKLKGHSQVSLAEESGVTQATISRIEKGSQQAELGTLIQILLALGAELTFTQREKPKKEDPLEGLI